LEDDTSPASLLADPVNQLAARFSM